MIFREGAFIALTLFFFSFQCFGQAWTQVADYGGGPCSFVAGGVINSKGYVLNNNEMWEYDPVADQWNQKANFPGSPRVGAVSFVINDILYYGTGNILFGALLRDWWKYDPSSNIWTQLNSFGGVERYSAVGFSIGSKGYITTGFATGSIYKNDIWEYNPASDSWNQKSNLPDAGKYLATGFSVSGKGYLVTGYESVATDVKDVWEYNPVTDNWLQKSNFAGVARRQAAGFSSSTYGYLATGGTSSSALNDAWKYNPATDAWSALPNLPAGGRRSAIGFVIDEYAYLGIGFVPSGTTYQDFWKLEVEPETILPIELIAFTGTILQEGNLLEWSTGSEFNNDYFTIERSLDGESFTKLSQIDGKGNTMVTSHYYFLDYSFLPGINYYRLKQSDFDRTYAYSNIVTIERTTSAFEWTISYNQGDATLHFEIFSPADKAVTISLLNNTGHTLMETVKNISKGYNKMKVKLPVAATGICFVMLNTSGNERSVKKVLLW